MQIVLVPDLHVEGVIAWSVWHKAGVTLSQPLAEATLFICTSPIKPP